MTTPLAPTNMKGTSIFLFKSWPKIHKPLPRTPRESRQLLNALTSSFRRQLDHAYPSSNAASNKDGDRQSLNFDSSVHLTDMHMHNILNNPLFRIVPSKDASHHPNALQSAEWQRLLAEKPMDALDQLVASGSATGLAITECLKAQLALTHSSDDDRMRLAMRDAKAASRVVNWFWASDGASRRKLLQSRASSASLAKFMVAEGLHDTVLNWLKMLMNGDLGGQNGLIIDTVVGDPCSSLLYDFVDAEIRYGDGLDSALAYYSRVCQMYFSIDGASRPSIGSAKAMLRTAGVHLSNIAMDRISQGGQVSTSNNYDSFMKAISTITSTRSFLYASVAVSHPTNPDPKPFILFTETLTPSKFERFSASRRIAFLTIGCEALRILMIDRRNERDWSYLARQIQELLPGAPTSEANNASSERVTSEENTLLNRLDLNLT